MATRAFAWLATYGGAWSLPANWNDLTDGMMPSLVAPGPQDNVSVAGPTGSIVETITGPGAALLASFAGNTALSGNLALGTVGVGLDGSGALLDIGAAAVLQAASGTIASGSLLASGTGGEIEIGGMLTVGAGQSGHGAAAANFDVTNAGIAQVGGLVLDAGSAAIYVDPTGSLEIGLAGGAAGGALTVDAGATLSGQGDANGYGQVINNGTIAAAGGTLLLGPVRGFGVLDIGAGATLVLNGATGAGQAVAFTSPLGTLAVATEADAPAGTLTGFAPGDAIHELGSPISTATYAPTGSSTGVLTLTYGGQVAGTFILAGDYTGDVFLTAGDGALGTLITVAPATQGGGGASSGTIPPDQYSWIAAGGAWNVAANWTDVTKGATPPRVAPGPHNLVSIAAGQAGSFSVIAGPAYAATLGVTGDLALAGAFSFGTLTVGDGPNQVAGVLDLLPATGIRAAAAVIADGAITVSGSRALLAVAGTLTLGGGMAGVGLPVTSLAASAGGVVTAAALTLGGGSGDSITTDPAGIIEIGSAGSARAGAVTIDAGAVLSGNGSVNPFGIVVDNGTVQAEGGTLTLGSVAGGGVLAIGPGAALELESATAVPIAFADATGVLRLANELVAPSGTLTGFVPGDIIDIEGDPITGTATAKDGTTATISLYYGSTVVARMTLAGAFTGEHFLVVPDGANGTDVVLVTGSGGGNGGGQGGTDVLAWAAPGSGAWSRAVNWTDITTGQAASAPPGSQNPVEVAGPSAAGSFQVLGGPAACASLLVTGNTVITGAYTADALTLGRTIAGVAGAGTLDIGAAATFAAGQAAVLDGDLLVAGGGAGLIVAGTLVLGGGDAGAGTATALFSVTGQATAQLGGLALGGGLGDTVLTDQTGSIEIGTLGAAAAGAITVDAGLAVAGNGSLNPGGRVIDNGTVTAQGGTLSVGAVSGTGTLAIGGEATLALTAAESCPIVFIGGGGSLLLQGTAETPAGVIAGFVQGDRIVTGTSPVSSVAYAPGAGSVGTLTLYYGSQVAGRLLLAGDFSGEVFRVQADGNGADISVQSSIGGGASGGTPTPDQYVWLGGAGTSWNTAANWADLTTGASPAPVAPGANNLVTVQGATGSSFLTIDGPANAASLDVRGNLALAGQYSIGALAVGDGQGVGLLALGSGATAAAATAVIQGGVVLQGGGLSVSGTLALGVGGVGGVLAAAASATASAASLVLAGPASAVTADATSIVEIGQAGGARAGAVTIDAGAALSGLGAVNPLGVVVDNGTITAVSGSSGGTLAVGGISGTGTLEIGFGATLALEGLAAAGLLIDFAGGGTLSVASGAPAASIADFTTGDTILLPEAGIVAALYAATGAGVGVLTLDDSRGQAVAQLTLLGVGVGQSFAVSPGSGGTVLTTQITNPNGGGSNVSTSGNGSGSGQVVDSTIFLQSEPLAIQAALGIAIGGLTSYVWTSPDGSYFGPWQPGYANLAVVSDPVAHTRIDLPAAYRALLVEGGQPVTLTDGYQGNVLIVGNSGADTIVAHAALDTLIGGAGSTTFFAQLNDSIQGGGNDTYVTSQGNCTISTAAGARSLAFLGSAANHLTSNGEDTIVAVGGAIANDTIVATGADTVFAPAIGELTFYGGNGPDVVVASTGTIREIGGAGNGSTLWCGPGFTQFIGGAGTATVIRGSGDLSVQGGSGALTVYGGSGPNIFQGAAGPSRFLTGYGASTVTAASGNLVWLVGSANDSLVASGGNIVLWGANSTGDNIFQAGSGPVTIAGGVGRDTFIAGTGNATIASGGGADIFAFTNGLAGGSDVISGFAVGADRISLYGYAGGAAAALATAVVTGGNTAFTLGDGTHVELLGVTNLGASSFT